MSATFDGRGDNARDLTADEEKAVRSLLRLAKAWPRRLMLASLGGSLFVFDTEDHMRPGGDAGCDPEKVLARVPGIPNTGGDW